MGELWATSKARLLVYATYVALMLFLGAAEGLIASVALHYMLDVLKGSAVKLGLRSE